MQMKMGNDGRATGIIKVEELNAIENSILIFLEQKGIPAPITMIACENIAARMRKDFQVEVTEIRTSMSGVEL